MAKRLFYLVMGCLAFIMTIYFGTALSDLVFQSLALL